MWMDLFIDATRPRHLAASLYEQLRAAVADGRIRAGDQLPTSRWLAADLGISRATVTTVYGRLVAEGLLDGRVGDGTFVAEQPASPPGRQRARRPDRGRASSGLVRRSPLPVPDQEQTGEITIDLRSGRSDPALFPLRAWRRAVGDAVEVTPPQYGNRAGLGEFRGALAAWVNRSRGLSATANHVLVTSGAQQAFDLCAHVLVSHRGIVAFEEPGYEPARRAFLSRGARVHPVEVDNEGLIVDAIPQRAEMVFVTPSHQSVTGVTMSAARRRQLLDAAAARDMVVVEDDYDTEYRYVDRPLEPIHRLDPHGRVVYVGTFSKTLSPSLRLGFVVAPAEVVEALTAARNAIDAQPPHLVQAAMTEMLVNGAFERHLRRTRPIYAERHALVHREIQRLHVAGLVPAQSPTNAGLHVTLFLHDGADAAALARRMAERGVLIHTTDPSWIGSPRPGLVIGFGATNPDQLQRAFELLADELAPI